MTPDLALAVQNADLLRLIGDRTTPDSRAALGAAAGRDLSNLRRSLERLVEAGWLTPAGEGLPALTQAGRELLPRLAVLMGEAPAAEGELRVPLGEIHDNPDNPRTDLDTPEALDALEELARNIADKDVLQPILLRPAPEGLRIVAGDRRWRAAVIARDRGWLAADYAIPARVQDMTDAEAAEAALVENLQREDLNLVDEMSALRRLADAGKSGADLERLVGRRGRKKRSIQELIQFDRELSDADKAELRAGRITVEQARARVGDKKARPALDLPPRVRLAFLELYAYSAGTGEEVFLHCAPVTPALTVLADRKLVTFRFAGEHLLARLNLEDPAAQAYLAETGAAEDPAHAVRALRVEALGELLAHQIETAAAWATPDLNPPAAAPPSDPPPLGEGDREAVEGAAAEPPAPPSPLAALAVIELAHKLAREGVAVGFGDMIKVCPVSPGAAGDPLVRDLIVGRFLILLPLPGAGGTQAALTPTAQAWLQARGLPAGGPTGGDLYDARVEALGQAAADAQGDGYATAWLNVPATPAAAQDTPPLGEAAAQRPEGGGAEHDREAEIRARIFAACDALRPLQLLVMVEIADKLAREPTVRDRGDGVMTRGWVRVGQFSPDPLHVAQSLIEQVGLSFAWDEGGALAKMRDHALDWLAEHELLPGPETRDLVLAQVRAMASRQPAERCEYVTPWLNAAAAAAEPSEAKSHQSPLFGLIKEALADEDRPEIAVTGPAAAEIDTLRHALGRMLGANEVLAQQVEKARTRKLDAAVTDQVLQLAARAADHARATLRLPRNEAA